MPKCEADAVLQDQVRRYVSENKLSVNGAATMLGVNRTTFWRFHENGEALSRTKTQIREALASREDSTTKSVSDDSVDSGLNENRTHLQRQEVVADRELQQIRKACEGVLALLNVYEAQQLLTNKV